MKRRRKQITLSAWILASLFLFLIYPEKRPITETIRLESGHDFIKLSDGWTEYELDGPENGQPVILIHGLSVPMYDWDKQFYELRDAGFRVLRYNHYGRGLSDRPRTIYDADLYTRQIKEIMDSQGWEKAHILAHSMGGAIAAQFNRAYPDSTDRMILLAPTLHMAEDNTGISLIRIPVLGDLMAMTALTGILSSRAEELFSNAGIKEKDAYSNAFLDQTRYFGFSRTVKSLFRNNMVDDLSETWQTIDGGRTLLIWGTRDESIPENHIKKMEKLIPGLETHIIQDVGHMPNMEIPDTVNSLILEFL